MLRDAGKRELFELTVLPHLDAAYNLARWLVRNPHDAQDLTQESCERAWRFLESFTGGNARAWLLTIVRNTCYSWLQSQGRFHGTVEFNENVHQSSHDEINAGSEHMAFDPAELAQNQCKQELLMSELNKLPMEFREALVLRDIEGFSYQEISQIASIPMGTVMSRISRARRQLQNSLSLLVAQEP